MEQPKEEKRKGIMTTIRNVSARLVYFSLLIKLYDQTNVEVCLTDDVIS